MEKKTGLSTVGPLDSFAEVHEPNSAIISQIQTLLACRQEKHGECGTAATLRNVTSGSGSTMFGTDREGALKRRSRPTLVKVERLEKSLAGLDEYTETAVSNQRIILTHLGEDYCAMVLS